MATKQDIMAAYISRVVAGDMEGAAEHYTDDIAFHWAGHSPMSGDYAGKAAVLDMFADLRRRAESSVETHDTLYSDAHVVVLAKGTYAVGGRSLTTDRVVVYHFAGDKISEVWVVDADQQAVAELLA